MLFSKNQINNTIYWNTAHLNEFRIEAWSCPSIYISYTVFTELEHGDMIYFSVCSELCEIFSRCATLLALKM